MESTPAAQTLDQARQSALRSMRARQLLEAFPGLFRVSKTGKRAVFYKQPGCQGVTYVLGHERWQIHGTRDWHTGDVDEFIAFYKRHTASIPVRLPRHIVPGSLPPWELEEPIAGRK